MLARIREHNVLNGARFSTLEFGLACAAALFISVRLTMHGSSNVGFLLGGTALNCAVVTGISAVAWAKGRLGQSTRDAFRRDVRRPRPAEHQHLLADTLVLTVSALLPFALTVAVAVEAIRHAGDR